MHDWVKLLLYHNQTSDLDYQNQYTQAVYKWLKAECRESPFSGSKPRV